MCSSDLEHEHAGHGKPLFPAGIVGCNQRLHATLAALDGADSGVPEKFDLGLGKGPFLQHLGGTQLVAAMDDRDFVGKPGQMQRLLNGSVAAAYHGDLLIPVKGAVAGGMIRVGLADDERLITAGMAMILGAQEDIEVAWQAVDAQ